jgi:serine/threonine-protein kinase
MEYLEGHDLNQILRHHGPQMHQAVVDLMLQACEGIAEAHALGIVHRDIKPSNFFVTHRPDGSSLLKILDFGISKTPAEVTELTGTQTVIGTPTYMAPEQMRTARSTDPRSDIWSMGVVMYQMLAGRPPFESETYAALVLMVSNEPPAPLHIPIPAGLKDIVWRCLEKDPKNRIQNAGELARMLAPYASDPLSAQQSAERAMRILAARNSAPAYPQLAGLNMGNGLTPPPALTPKSWNHTNGSSLSAGVGQVGTQVVRAGRGKVIAAVAGLCVAAGTGGFLIASSRKNASADGSTHVSAPATQPVEMKAETTPTTPTTTPTTDTSKTDTSKTDTSKTDATKADTTKSDAVKTDTAKSETAKTDASKTDTSKTDGSKATTTAKTDTAKADATKTDASKATTAAKTDTAKTTTAAKTDTAKTTAAKTDTAKTATKSSSTKTTSTKTTSSKTKSTGKKKDDDLFDDRH